MAKLTVKPKRFDPYKNFKFRVKFDGRLVAGFSKCSPLKGVAAGGTKYKPITLERGVTHDGEFERWANQVWNYGSKLGKERSLKSFRKTIIIELLNENGQTEHAYKVNGAWVSELKALSDLDATPNTVALEHVKLEHGEIVSR